MTTSRIILIALIGIIAFVGVAAVFVTLRSRVKVEANSALVRTGFGGVKIETRQSETVLCLPMIHQHRMVRFTSRTVDIEIGGGDYASTGDEFSVSCQARVSISSLRDRESVLAQLMTSSSSGDLQDQMLQQKSTSAVKRILAARDLSDLAENLSIVDEESLKPLASQLETQGMTVEKIEIDNILLLRLEDISESDRAHRKTWQRLKKEEQEKLIQAQQAILVAATNELEELTSKEIAEGEEQAIEMQAELNKNAQEQKASDDQVHNSGLKALEESTAVAKKELTAIGTSSKDEQAKQTDLEIAEREKDLAKRDSESMQAQESKLEKIESDGQENLAGIEAEKTKALENLKKEIDEAPEKAQLIEDEGVAKHEKERADAVAVLDKQIVEQREKEKASRKSAESSSAEADHELARVGLELAQQQLVTVEKQLVVLIEDAAGESSVAAEAGSNITDSKNPVVAARVARNSASDALDVARTAIADTTDRMNASELARQQLEAVEKQLADLTQDVAEKSTAAAEAAKNAADNKDLAAATVAADTAVRVARNNASDAEARVAEVARDVDAARDAVEDAVTRAKAAVTDTMTRVKTAELAKKKADEAAGEA